MKFLLVDGDKLIGCVDTKDAVKRMSKLYFNDTGRYPREYVNVNGTISELGVV